MRRFRYPLDYAVIGFWAMFLTGVFFSLFLANGMKEYFIQKAGILSDYYFRQVKYQEFHGRELFFYFLGKRMKWAALLLGFSFLRIMLFAMLAFASWMGFSFGLLFGIGVLKFGTVGILVSLLVMLPQGIFYLAGGFTVLLSLLGWEQVENYWQAFPFQKLLRGIVLLFFGILTESYVNPWCLRLIFRLI